MKNFKFWRTALAVALVLTVMLSITGGTIAWFTDSVESTGNTITSGTLDIELEEGSFIGANMFEDKLWEPGAVAVKSFSVKNVGTLALRYKASMYWENGNTLDGHSLTEVIKVAVLNELPEDADELTAAGRQALLDAVQGNWVHVSEGWDEANQSLTFEGRLAAGETAENGLVIVAYWEPTDNDNDYNANNGKQTSDSNPLYINLGMKLTATQDTVEADSFDHLYDANAWDDVADEAPLDEEEIDGVRTIYVSSAQDLVKAAKRLEEHERGKFRVEIEKDINLSGRFWTPINLWGAPADLVIDGNGHSITGLTISKDEDSIGFISKYANGVGLTIENLTFVDPRINTTKRFAGVVIGYQYGVVTLNNVDVKGGFIGNTNPSSTNTIRVGALVGYSVQNDGAKLNLKDCDVTDATISGYHNVGALLGSTVDSSMKNLTVENCSSSGNTLVYGATGGVGAHDFGAGDSGYESLKPDGFVLGQNTIKQVTIISTSADMTKLANGGNFVLANDIDMAGVEYTAPNLKGSLMLDGNGYTIRNLSASANTVGLIGHTSSGIVTITNLTLDNAKITGTNQDGENAAGAFIGWANEGATVVIENCHVINSKLSDSKYIGGLVGYKGSHAQLTIQNCSVKKSTLETTYNEEGTYKGHMGGIIGLINGTSPASVVTGNTVESNTFVNENGSGRVGIYAGTNYTVISGNSHSGNTGVTALQGNASSGTAD